jgi:hypothetical protein
MALLPDRPYLISGGHHPKGSVRSFRRTGAPGGKILPRLSEFLKSPNIRDTPIWNWRENQNAGLQIDRPAFLD